jgi:cbb3-type cytochrome oxidase maturation protein
MTVIYILLPVAVFLAVVALVGFIKATREGQWDDLDTPAHRILHDEAGTGSQPTPQAPSGKKAC